MRRTIVSFALVASAALLAGCASSGVVKTGPNTYMIANSEWGFTSGGYQKAKAVSEADTYCQSMGKEILVIGSSAHGVRFGRVPSADVEFKCLAKVSPAQHTTRSPP